MKLVTCVSAGRVVAGYLDGDEIVVCNEGDGAARAVLELVRGYDHWVPTGESLNAERVRYLAPIPEPVRDIFCIGKNYRAHAAEVQSGDEVVLPSAPVVFTKATTSVCGSGDEVKASLDPTASVDYEGELAVVIGKAAFQVSRDQAMDHVFGYTIVNDVTSRKLQKEHQQWVIGKGIDTFCPMGPCIVTSDEIGDVSELEIVTKVNGEERQRAKVGELLFDIPTLIETMSRTMTLLPGDIIATGTPAGVGIGHSPPKFLKPGDRMRVSITGLGALENPVA